MELTTRHTLPDSSSQPDFNHRATPSAKEKSRRHRVIAWITKTISVKGHPMIVMFPPTT
ncbi:MAG: hypothetical protein UV59_C0012G0075 [Candidatus Gottesmanbacteria bacterium GW2011_GWA1_43_11]|uniref:Uncharacterized protein n=1 Tax=Candidatus Gottesmanbacteria bacterium GW2011_GWA1_43_11 TaxID=1618436 RepID=A0A0G1CHJ1_9BACT|nr:MAG: hypothetical protein UV59_C0012G0075 [Candidatus Gottesmanbacteria bacterium GW2011_GWA1_43_11]